MKVSKFIKTITDYNPHNPGEIISLDIHQVDGGFVGIDSSFTEDVANYIANPYEDCQLVKLQDPMGNDDEIDPPLEEDELVGFLKILVALDATSQLLPSDHREALLDGLAKRAKLTRDRLNVLLGLAQGCIENAALFQFQRVLKDGSSNNCQ